MTFEQFQATRKWADDIRAAVPEADHLEPDNTGHGVSGFHYHGGLHIISYGGGASPQSFVLQIANVIEQGEDLTELERKLYEWGLAEGVFD
jgi:hypothetical protein